MLSPMCLFNHTEVANASRLTAEAQFYRDLSSKSKKRKKKGKTNEENEGEQEGESTVSLNNQLKKLAKAMVTEHKLKHHRPPLSHLQAMGMAKEQLLKERVSKAIERAVEKFRETHPPAKEEDLPPNLVAYVKQGGHLSSAHALAMQST